MSTVTFPGLGLTLHLNRVAFSIEPFTSIGTALSLRWVFFFGVAFLLCPG